MEDLSPNIETYIVHDLLSPNLTPLQILDRTQLYSTRFIFVSAIFLNTFKSRVRALGSYTCPHPAK